MDGEGVFIWISAFSFGPKFVAIVVGWISVCLSSGSLQKASSENWGAVEWGKGGSKGNKHKDCIGQKTGLWG